MQESRSKDAISMDLMARVFIYAKKWKDKVYGSLKKILGAKEIWVKRVFWIMAINQESAN